MPSFVKDIYFNFLKSYLKIEPSIKSFEDLLIFTRVSGLDFEFKINIKKLKKDKIKINNASSPILTSVNKIEIPKDNIKINTLEEQNLPVRITNLKAEFISIIRDYDLDILSELQVYNFSDFEMGINTVKTIKCPQIIDEIVEIFPYIKNFSSQKTLDMPIQIKPADKKDFTKTEFQQLKRQLANANKTTINNVDLSLIYPGFLPENYRTIKQDEETKALYCYFNENNACKKCSNYYLLMGFRIDTQVSLRALAILRKK